MAIFRKLDKFYIKNSAKQPPKMKKIICYILKMLDIFGTVLYNFLCGKRRNFMNYFKRRKINLKLIGKKSIFIDDSVVIGKNVTIDPNNIIKGNTVIGDNVTLLPNNYIVDSEIKNDVTIDHSYIEESSINDGAHIGPFSRLRPNANIGKNCKIGNFVEVKNSNVCDGTKASHLAYIGDADIGKNCNIGCGAIFVNYNGKEKNRSIIGDDCFIGSNVNVVAPVYNVKCVSGLFKSSVSNNLVNKLVC